MKLKTPYIILLLVFCVLVVYYPTIFAPFNSVDDMKMINGLLNSGPLSLRGLFLPGGSGYYYRPLPMLSFYCDMYLWGPEESFMHLENIILHATNSVLIFFIIRRLFLLRGQNGSIPSTAAALLFALHPINTEAVNWISGRTDLLAGFFIFLSTLLLLIAYQRENNWICLASASTFFVGCLAKETAVFFFAAAIIIIVFLNSNNRRLFDTLRQRLVWFTVFTTATAGYFWLRSLAFSGGDSGVHDVATRLVSPQINLMGTARIMLKVSGFYLKKLFLPWPLNFAIDNVANIYTLLGLVLVLICSYFFYNRSVISAFSLSAVCVGSSALVLALSRLAWTPIAERYLYIPCGFFAIAVTLVVTDIVYNYPNLKRMTLIGFPCIIGITGWSTVSRNMVWQDNLTLFQDTVSKSPNFAPAWNELALALGAHGRKEQAKQIFLKNSADVTLNNYQMATINRTVVLASNGNLQEARKILKGNLQTPGKQENELLAKLIFLDEKLCKQLTDKTEIIVIRKEIISLLQRTYGLTHDPFCFYRIGQIYLLIGDKSAAADSFACAYKDAAPGSYYKEPARKLALKLQQ